jgi:hypothetical protein
VVFRSGIDIVAPAIGLPVARLVTLPVISPLPVFMVAKRDTDRDDRMNMLNSILKIDLSLIIEDNIPMKQNAGIVRNGRQGK